MTRQHGSAFAPSLHRVALHRMETIPVTRVELFALRDGASIVRRLEDRYPRSQKLEAWRHLFYATQDAMKDVLALPDFKSTDEWTATLIARALRIQALSAIDMPSLDGAPRRTLGSLDPEPRIAKSLTHFLLWPRDSLRELSPEILFRNSPPTAPDATKLQTTRTRVLHVGKLIGFHIVARHRHLPRRLGIDESDALRHDHALDAILNAAAAWTITDLLPFRSFAAIRLLTLLDTEERAALDITRLAEQLPGFDIAGPAELDRLAADEQSTP